MPDYRNAWVCFADGTVELTVLDIRRPYLDQLIKRYGYRWLAWVELDHGICKISHRNFRVDESIGVS